MRRGWADHPLAPGAAGLAFAAVVVAIHLARVDGDVSRFVRASPPWADPSAVPAGLHVGAAGYDGMFYYRVALDPGSDRATDRGITFDRPAYRQQRVVYPSLAWLVALGDPSRVPLALVIVNVIAQAAVGWLGGALARTAGRHALWGILFVLYPGSVVTLTSDLTEIVAAAFLLGSLLLLRRDRTMPAAVLLTFAMLTRETAALATGAFALTRALVWRATPRRWVPFVIPIVALAAWEATLALRWRSLAPTEGAGSFALPLVGLAEAAWRNGERLQGTAAVVWPLTAVFVLATVVLGARALSRGLAHERAAWWTYALLAAVLEANIWANEAMLRALTELGMITALLVLGAPARLRWGLLAMDAALCALLVVAGLPS